MQSSEHRSAFGNCRGNAVLEQAEVGRIVPTSTAEYVGKNQQYSYPINFQISFFTLRAA